ncbi:AAA family ATPase [Candidatus Woesearchaeota archaeon]|nr:AAA family ATPase [Candidatus Woesearchaeota archaeon]
MAKRIKTGVQGFDKLIEGGIPQGHTVLVIGTPGTGKTLFTLEYIHNGVSKFKEKSMYITLEQSLDSIREQAKGIGLDISKLEKSGKLTLMHIPADSLGPHSIDEIKAEVRKRKVTRLVVDSLSTLAVNAPIYTPIKDIALRDIMNYKAFFSPPVLGDFVIKRFIYGFLTDLKSLGCTTLVTSEAPEKGEYLSRDTVSEFQADGVLLLTFESMGGEYSRSLLIRKMRGTHNDEDIHPLEISSKGLKVHTIK